MTIKKPRVFISHNKADKSVAAEIALFLAAENIGVWFDEWQISAGDSIVEEINKGLKSCSHFIILWSKNSSKSRWVRRELYSVIAQAIEKSRLRVIPICVDETRLPKLLSDIRYIKYEGGTENDRRSIVLTISGRRPSHNFVTAIIKKYQELLQKPVFDGVDSRIDGPCPFCDKPLKIFITEGMLKKGVACFNCIHCGFPVARLAEDDQ